MQCMEQMKKEEVDDPDGIDLDDDSQSYGSMWSVVPLGASNDGPGRGPEGEGELQKMAKENRSAPGLHCICPKGGLTMSSCTLCWTHRMK